MDRRRAQRVLADGPVAVGREGEPIASVRTSARTVPGRQHPLILWDTKTAWRALSPCGLPRLTYDALGAPLPDSLGSLEPPQKGQDLVEEPEELDKRA